MRRTPLTTRSLMMASAAALALTAAPALAAEQSFAWTAVGQASGVYATDPAPGGERWNGFAGYALGGDWQITTDSGLKYGLAGSVGSGDYQKSDTVDGPRPGNNEKVTVNEAYLYLTSAYGTLRLGDEDGAAKRAVDLLPVLVGGQMDGFWTGVPGAAPPADHLGRESDDATKLLYETPRIMGLRAGLSYAVERESLVEDIEQASDLPAEEDIWELGLNYRGDLDALSYELGVGYVRGEGGSPLVEDTESLKLSGLVYYGGFSAGVVWFDDGDSARLSGQDAAGVTVQGAYENGPYGLTVFWHDSEAERVVDYTAYGLGLSWRVTDTLALGLDAVRYDAERFGAVRDDDGWLGSLTAQIRF